MAKRLTNELSRNIVSPLSYSELQNEFGTENLLKYKGVENLNIVDKTISGTKIDLFSFRTEDRTERELFFGDSENNKILFIQHGERSYSYSHADRILSLLSIEADRISAICNDISKTEYSSFDGLKDETIDNFQVRFNDDTTLEKRGGKS